MLQGNQQRRDLLDACEVCGPEAAVLAFGLSTDVDVEGIQTSWKQDQFGKDDAETLKRLDIVMNKKTTDCQDCVKKYKHCHLAYYSIVYCTCLP